MVKKVEFLDVPTREVFSGIRALLGRVHWKSARYRELMDFWRVACRVQILRISQTSELDTDSTVWRSLYELCPSGSLEERVALGEWQNLLIFTSLELRAYRQRVHREGLQALAQLKISSPRGH